jgi:hypothetical protein
MGHADVVTQNGVEEKCFARDIYVFYREDEYLPRINTDEHGSGEGKAKAYHE